MALTEALRLVIDADARGAVKGLESVGKTADKELGKTDKGIQRVGHTMQKVGVGMVATGALLVGGLVKAAKASEEAAVSTRKLENSVKNNAALAGHSAKEFTDLAAAIQKKTAADADDITAGIAVLAQGKLQARQIKELTPLVVDLARKKGVDEVTAFTMASKAVAGSTGALKKAGIQVDENLAKTDAYKATIDALRSSVGGYAEEEGKTFSGQLERVKNQLGDIQEGVGVGAVDAFSKLLKPVGALSDKFGELDPQTQSMIGQIGTFGATGLIAAGGVATLVGKVITMREQLGGTFGIIAKGSGVLAAGGTAWALYTSMMDRAKEAGSHAADSLASIFAEADPTTVTMDQLTREMGNLQNQIVSTSDAMRGSSAPWDADTRTQQKAAIDSGEKVLDQWARLKYAAEALAREQGLTEDAALQQILANDKLTTSAMAAGDSFDVEAAATAGLTAELTELNDALRAQFDPLFAAQDAALGLADAQRAAAEATKEHGARSTEAVAANRAATEAALNYESALLNLQTAVENGDVSLADATGTLKRWVDQGYISKAAADQSAWSFGILAANAKSVPSNVKTTVTADTSSANATIAAFRANVARLAANPFRFLVEASASKTSTKGYGQAGGGRVPQYRSAGGWIDGPRGTDTTPLWGTPGEFMVQKKAADRLGPAAMQQINQGRLPVVGGGGGPSSMTVVLQVDKHVLGRVTVDGLSSYNRTNGPIPVTVR